MTDVGRATHRPITADDAARWFQHPRGRPWPEPRHLTGLVAVINGTRLPNPRAASDAANTAARLRRVRAAIETLTAELPALIAGAEGSHRAAAAMGRDAWRSRERTILPAQRLLDAARAADDVFLVAAKGKPGRKRPWRANAETARTLAIGAWRAAGRMRPLGYHRTGPLVSAICSALEAFDTPADPDAVAKWLEQRAKDTKKSK